MSVKVNAIRKIDYWLGIPICFLLSIFDLIFGRFKFTSHKDSKENILLIKLSELGAIILAAPLCARLRQQFPGGQIIWLTFKKNTQLLNALGEKDILTIDDSSLWLMLADLFKVIKELRRRRISVALDLEFFSRFTAILSYLSGASTRIGFFGYAMEGLYRGSLLTHRVPYNPLIHISKMYYSFAEDIKLKSKKTQEISSSVMNSEFILPKPGIDKDISEKFFRRMQDEFGSRFTSRSKIFIMNLGDGVLPMREWPLGHYIHLAKEILSHEDCYIVLAGVVDGNNKAKRLVEAMPAGRCSCFMGMTSIPELLALCNMGTVLIASDCGLAHIASLTDIKQVVLFGPETPIVFGPLGSGVHILYRQLPCSPCFSAFNHRQSFCGNNLCLSSISGQEVYRYLFDMGLFGPGE